MSNKSKYFLLIIKPMYSAKFSSTLPNSQILHQILKYSAKSPNTPQISVYLDQVQLKGQSTWWSWSQVQLSSQAQIVVLETNSTKYSSLFSWTFS